MAQLAALLLAGAPGVLMAQGPSDLNEGTKVEWDNTNDIWRFSWWGRSGKTYFIQHSDDLASWTYVPIIEPGNDAIREWGFTRDGDKFFLRLRYTDQVASDPYGVSNNDELAGGTDPLGIRDANSEGIPDEWGIYPLNKFVVYPPQLTASLSRMQTAIRTILLNNATSQPVNYNVAVTGNTGPSYSHKDSATGGVPFVWENISVTGTRLASVSNAYDGYEPVTLSFSFPFFGQNFSTVYVSSKGLLSFGSGAPESTNLPLKQRLGPPNAIFPLWDDLNTVSSGDIYYKQESNRLIIQYQDVAGPSTGTSTFQVVLFPMDGSSFATCH